MVAPAMTNSSSNLAAAAPSSSPWTWSEQKRFETALCLWTEQNGEFEPNWEAFFFPGKSPTDCKLYFDMLVRDVESIEAGRALLPDYASSGEEAVASSASDPPLPAAAAETPKSRGSAGRGNKEQQERRKGLAWTEEEHRQFLRGLEIYGKGDWRSISRHFVVSRTPTQVASHAQKYFIRLNSMKKDSKRRNSIHDITTATTAPAPTFSAAPLAESPPQHQSGGMSNPVLYAGYPGDFYFYPSRNSPMPMHQQPF